MDDPTIEEVPGSAPDLAAMLAEAALPTNDLAELGRRFFRFSEQGDVVGFVGWESADGQIALLRSLVVAPRRRGRGDGGQMIRWALTRLAELGFTDAYVLTTTIAALAQRQGFVRIERDTAPAAIRASRQFAELCPATAILLHRRLP